jgi:DNA polymerase-1
MMSDSAAPRLFLLDGMNLIYRAYFGLQSSRMSTSAGLNTAPIFGFASMLLEIIDKHKPSHLVVAWDTPEPTARHEKFPEYKAQREAMPEDLSAAIPHVRRIVDAMKIGQVRCPGYEADDIVGTLTRLADAHGFKSYMVTTDKDYAQLVSDHTKFFRPGSRGDITIMGVPEICEKWCVDKPAQVVEVLGLWGDTSDNIPGIPRVGEKTAKKLIAEFKSIENLLANTDKLKGKQRENVETYGDQALLARELITIDREVPIDVALEDLAWSGWDEDALKKLCAEFEFRTLGRRLFGRTFEVKPQPVTGQLELFAAAAMDGADTAASGTPAPPAFKRLADVQHAYAIADDDAALEQLLTTLAAQPAFCFDTETTSRDAKNADLVGIAFGWEPHSCWYVPFPDERGAATALLERFRPIFSSVDVRKSGHNLHYDLTVLRWHGLRVSGPLFDTMLAAYVLEADGHHSLDRLAETFLHYRTRPYQEVLGARADLRSVPVSEVADYACEDVDVTLQLAEKLQPLLEKEGLQRVLRDVELPLVPVLVEMERAGIRMNADALSEYGRELEAETLTLTERIYNGAGMPFNIDSPKQLGEVLFGHLELDPKAKRTAKTGQFATSEAVLTRLANRHPIVRDVLDYRACRKLISTYVNMLPGCVRADTGRVHTTYSQAVTATGRMQSTSPNMQNIPVRSERGREIRKVFIAADDDRHRLLAADYSQIELRIIASMSGDKDLIGAFRDGLDIHTATAARVFNVDIDAVEPDMRSRAKMVNFGIIYGISAFGLAQRLGIRQREAREIIDAYFEKYPGIKDYLDSTIAFCRDKGYVETLTGRRRYLPDIASRNGTVRSAAERNAINAPIQGTAADMIKIAMSRVQTALDDGGFATRMLLQVHDELVFDLVRDEREAVVPMVIDAMQNALPMDVPIVVDVGIGGNWLDAH